MVDPALATKYERGFGLAQPRRRPDQRVQHCLQFERRSADHLEHVGGCGLLLQGLGKLAGPLVELPLQIGRREMRAGAPPPASCGA